MWMDAEHQRLTSPNWVEQEQLPCKEASVDTGKVDLLNGAWVCIEGEGNAFPFE
jgi:hypothetical protein